MFNEVGLMWGCCVFNGDLYMGVMCLMGWGLFGRV